jgi:hypothetical protein
MRRAKHITKYDWELQAKSVNGRNAISWQKKFEYDIKTSTT